MTPIFCCGFECGITGFTESPHWVASGTWAVSTSTVRSGARSLRLNPSAGLVLVSSKTLTGHTSGVSRVYVRFATFPDRDTKILTTNGGSGAAFKQSDSTLRIIKGDGTLGASGYAVTTGVWYRLDLKVNTVANPHVIDCKVDGNDLTQVTYAVGASTITRWDFGVNTGGFEFTGDIFLDDFIASSESGDYPIGPGYVHHFVPTSDGTHNVASSADFKRGAAGVDITNATTDSYLLVDDVPMDDTTPDTDDFINAIAPLNATDYTENKFGPAPGILTPAVGPRAVDAVVAHHQAGTGSGVSAFKLNDNGTEDTIVSLSGAGVTTIRYARKHYATMVGGGAWTAARFNNLRIRFGYSSDANPDQYFDCAMIEAEFEDRFAKPQIVQQAVKRANFF